MPRTHRIKWQGRFANIELDRSRGDAIVSAAWEPQAPDTPEIPWSDLELEMFPYTRVYDRLTELSRDEEPE